MFKYVARVKKTRQSERCANGEERMGTDPGSWETCKRKLQRPNKFLHLRSRCLSQTRRNRFWVRLPATDNSGNSFLQASFVSSGISLA